MKFLIWAHGGLNYHTDSSFLKGPKAGQEAPSASVLAHLGLQLWNPARRGDRSPSPSPETGLQAS